MFPPNLGNVTLLDAIASLTYLRYYPFHFVQPPYGYLTFLEALRLALLASLAITLEAGRCSNPPHGSEMGLRVGSGGVFA